MTDLTNEQILADACIKDCAKLAVETTPPDAAHDVTHCLRVLENALVLGREEKGNLRVLAAAAFLHDIANLPKNHPESHLSSEKSAEQAEAFLKEKHPNAFTDEELSDIADAILCHSFSRGLTPKTHNGRIFQDADRLDGIGAVGIARTFVCGGKMARSILYHPSDPFYKTDRDLNDKVWGVDHFYRKLLLLKDTMQTKAGTALAEHRTKVMQDFLDTFESEIKNQSVLHALIE